MKLKIAESTYIQDRSTLVYGKCYRIEPITVDETTYDYIYILSEYDEPLDFNLNTIYCEHISAFKNYEPEMRAWILQQLQILDLPPISEWSMRKLGEELWDGTQNINTNLKYKDWEN